ncbi:hypothetical protein [Corynebacterium anserum]|uniref:Uncharacterized protein n=1 Tax=Corynebacterium anserum TaxID=2684406 RepID=A0A7G7YPG9_9CORY|nr:hypothetical protein [Corynebacterium anserum]MBC2682016.1 hypothetical protein [Corynebacterium anserum]QNH96389.1 hypothetical protein GP473_06725 [Corynebacterium anserum]
MVFISSPQALAAELLLWGSQLEGLVAIEAMLHQRKITIDAVEPSLEFMKRRRGKSRKGRSAQDIAKETLMLITDCSESPRESEVKYELWKAGFPAPYQQVDIFKAKLSDNWVRKADFLGRVDFMFPCGLVVEYDGRDKYLDTKSNAYFDLDGAHSSARLGMDGAHSSARLGKIDPQKIMEERQRERRIQNQGFEVIRIDAESFKEGAWLNEVRQSLERRRAEGRIAPEGKWHARAWAWGDRSGR